MRAKTAAWLQGVAAVFPTKKEREMAGERVLLVDDEEDFVDALSARLEARDLEVESASSGQEAIEKARARRYDAVIMDLAMPGMSGIDALQVLRDEQPELQIILLTGHATLQKGVEAMKVGAMDFLEKPADVEVLMDKIREAKAKSEHYVEKHTQEIIDDILKTKGW
jgi:DNA-binding NtrC family response regulator